MIYKSNLTAPDLAPDFKHCVSRPMPHSFGHDVLSDWADKSDTDPMFGLYKQCGYWTHDEAAILYTVANRFKGKWLDIGAATGWTSAHIAAGSQYLVDCVDPMLDAKIFRDRFKENTKNSSRFATIGYTSNEFFERCPAIYHGICIDGDHQPGKPLEDAIGAEAHLADEGVIIFHDGIGRPVREAVTWLMDKEGFKTRVYFTPHIVFLCWRGEFRPPDHTPDSQLVDELAPHMTAMRKDFDFGRCE